MLLLEKLRSKDQLDCERAVIDSSHMRPPDEAQKRAEPSRPRTAGQQVPPHHRRQGIPLAVSLTGGNRNDVTQLKPLLDKIPAVAGRVGRPRRRPDALLADRGYDHDKYSRLLLQ